MDIQSLSFRETPVLAVVVPCFNEQESIPEAVETLLAVVDQLVSAGSIAPNSFLYFIDDGSSDASWHMLRSANDHDGRVKALKLSRNFGHQNALLAGLSSIKDRCDVSISIDADLQQDPNSIGDFIKAYKDGADVVFGIRNDRNSDDIFKKNTASIFYRMMSLMGVTIIPNHADYRLLSRKALAALAEYSEPDPFLRAICAQLGFKSGTVYFDVIARKAGVSKYSLSKMLGLAVTGVTSFSVVPLRIIAVLGLLIFGVTVMMSLYVLGRTVFVHDTVPGWASTTLPIYFLGGIQLLCMGIIGEYLAKVLDTVKARPRFISEAELF
jgi:glycosyltransferase involved in cell wall biosynthesis